MVLQNVMVNNYMNIIKNCMALGVVFHFSFLVENNQSFSFRSNVNHMFLANFRFGEVYKRLFDRSQVQMNLFFVIIPVRYHHTAISQQLIVIDVFVMFAERTVSISNENSYCSGSWLLSAFRIAHACQLP
jgi:hypothetical protein